MNRFVVAVALVVIPVAAGHAADDWAGEIVFPKAEKVAVRDAQKKPVVRPTRVVDAVQINNPGFDKPAQFEQMVPIAAVPREP